MRAATPADAPAVVDTIVMGFSTDPVARWCWPEPHRYLMHMPGFVRGFAGRAFEHDGAICTEDGAGAALWLPPGVHADEEALGAVVATTCSAPWSGSPSTIRTGRTGTCR